MPKYKIRTKQYCNLSQEQKWQSWLQSVSQELYDDLMTHMEVSRSCKQNYAKMLDIQQGLEKRGLLPQMVLFLKREYPYAVEEIRVGAPKGQIRQRPSNVVEAISDAVVFEHYHPNLLTFPQKLVLENDDQEQLLREVKDFCQGKVGVDFIIIGNKAYIEYFKLKYTKEAKKISPNRREIHQFRLKHGISKDQNVANIGKGLRAVR